MDLSKGLVVQERDWEQVLSQGRSFPDLIVCRSMEELRLVANVDLLGISISSYSSLSSAYQEIVLEAVKAPSSHRKVCVRLDNADIPGGFFVLAKLQSVSMVDFLSKMDCRRI